MSNRLLLYFLGMFFLTASAQQKENPIIHLKQRILQRPQSNFLETPLDSTHKLHLMIAGNIYQTEGHIADCFDAATGKYNFRDELKYIQPILSIGDITIGNLKTSFANDPANIFSTPDEFALAIKYSGINALMHANLHAANVDRTAYQRTHRLMDELDLRYTGVFNDKFQRLGNYPLIIEKKGFRIALLDYCNMTRQPDISSNFFVNKIDRDQILLDLRMAKANRPDFTIVYFDWGADNREIPSFEQTSLARFCFEQGADLIVGTQPNAPMRLDYINYYSDGQYKDGIVAYSLGNLIASTEDVNNRDGYLMDVELAKNSFTGQTTIADWGVIPVYTYFDTLSEAGKTAIYSVPCSAVESGDILTKLPYIEKRRVINSAYKVRRLVGATADEIQYNLTEQVVNNVMETIGLTNAPWNNPYSQKRPSLIKPSDAPVVSATLTGANPPSLEKIYGSETSANSKETAQKEQKKTKYDVEKAKAESVFAANEKTQEQPAGTALKTEEHTTAPSAKQESEKTVAAEAPVQPPLPQAAEKSSTTAHSQTEDNSPDKKTNNIKKEEAQVPPKTPVVEHKSKASTSTTEATERKRDKGLTVAPKVSGAIQAETKEHLKGTMDLVKGKELKLVTDTFYRIQFYALKKYVPLDTNYYTHLKGFEVIEDTDGLFKYMLGWYKSYDDCYKFWKSQMQPRYKESFIIKYIDGKRVLE